MTVDLSEFITVPKKRPCKVGRAIEQMTTEEREKFEAALAEPSVHGVKIAEVVTSWGYPLSDTTVIHHRKGKCPCAGLD